MWEVDVGSGSDGSALLARLVGVIHGCVTCDPTHRWTIGRVLDTLAGLQRDMATGGISGGGGGGVSSTSSGGGASPIVVRPQTYPAASEQAAEAAAEAVRGDREGEYLAVWQWGKCIGRGR